jgi:hypothetical protein
MGILARALRSLNDVRVIVGNQGFVVIFLFEGAF